MAITKNKGVTPATDEKKEAPAKKPDVKGTKPAAESKPSMQKNPSAQPDTGTAKDDPTKKPANDEASSVQEDAAPEAKKSLGHKELAQGVHDLIKAQGKAIPVALAQLAIEAFEQVIADALAEGYEVNLAGFGKFSSVHRDESERPNPAKKGEKVTVPAHNAPKFKPSTALKKALNGGEEAGEDE